MKIKEVIKKKNKTESLSGEEIGFVIDNYTKGLIKDEDMTLFLKAVVANGMTEEETIDLTKAMLQSGSTLSLQNVYGVKADKHSTGGVGDKTTLIVGSLVAACDVNFVKMSGRALGFTGGTIDKLESIPGFNVSLSSDKFIRQLQEIKFAITSQTDDLVVADKKIYALRDITNTVSSIPLIASSIMSKKLATSADVIVLDVKVGNGALVETLEEARELANLMVKIGHSFKKQIVAILSNMSEPLGHNIGNSLEIEEVIETLKGEGEQNLVTLSKELAIYTLMLAKEMTYVEALVEIEEALNSGRAYHKFTELIKTQGGDLLKIPKAKSKVAIKTNKAGFVKSINAKLLGQYSMSLGAGRQNVEDIIDYSVGLVVPNKIGDYVNAGDVLLEIHSNTEITDISKIEGFLTLSETKTEPMKIIIEILK